MLQFGTGDVAAPSMSSSASALLAEKKQKVVKALKDVQTKTITGPLQQLMMQHFKETTNHHFFYTLPVDILKSLPIKQMATALTHMLAVKGQAAQPSGTLPLADIAHCLPLADRAKGIEDIRAKPFLEPLQDESQDTGGETQIVTIDETKLSLHELVDHCQKGGHFAFRVADKNPQLKKRPLHSVDNVVSGDLAIRAYCIKRVGNPDSDGKASELWVSPTSNAEVSLLQLFEGKDPDNIIQHMWSWKLVGGFDADAGCFQLERVRRAFDQRPFCPLDLNKIDIDTNIKPTCFELYLELRKRSWTWKSWVGKPADLKRVQVNIDPANTSHSFYTGSFYYLLCLATFPQLWLDLQNKKFLYHGQLEAYYAAAFHLAQQQRFQELENLPPNKSAQFYRTLVLEWGWW